MGLTDDELVIGWVGRLVPIKGCDLFIEALAGLGNELANGRRWRSVVIGDGPEVGTLRTIAMQRGLGDRVDFLGSVMDAARLMPAFDLFALSSRSEGTPMVLLEAMGAGVPVVAFGVGGVPDLVRGGIDGLVVPPGDVGGMVDAIRSTLESPNEALFRASNARARVMKDFDRKEWARHYIQLYESLIRDLR